MRFRNLSIVAAVLVFVGVSPASAEGKVRVGVLQYGTVDWLMDVIKHHGLDKAEGFSLETTPFAGVPATTLALQGGAADIIATDWLWVTRQRSEGADFTFSPFSTALGGIMVPKDSPINSIKDLKGKSLAVAGGPLDKSWLMLTAYVLKNAEFDLRAETKPVYGSPPLLTEKARSGEVDAILNYWPYAARLEALGFHQLIGVEQVVTALSGIEQKSKTSSPVTVAEGDTLAMVGFAFKESWAKDNPDVAKGFISAARKANDLLAKSEDEWKRIRPLMQADDDATFDALKRRYREGIPKGSGDKAVADAGAIYKILRDMGGEKLVGPGAELAPGTFWKGSPS